MRDEHVKKGRGEGRGGGRDAGCGGGRAGRRGGRKDAAQDVAEDVTQDVAEDVFGAAKDERAKVLIVKVLILPIAICQLRTHAQHARAYAS